MSIAKGRGMARTRKWPSSCTACGRTQPSSALERSLPHRCDSRDASEEQEHTNKAVAPKVEIPIVPWGRWSRRSPRIPNLPNHVRKEVQQIETSRLLTHHPAAKAPTAKRAEWPVEPSDENAEATLTTTAAIREGSYDKECQPTASFHEGKVCSVKIRIRPRWLLSGTVRFAQSGRLGKSPASDGSSRQRPSVG